MNYLSRNNSFHLIKTRNYTNSILWPMCTDRQDEQKDINRKMTGKTKWVYLR